MRVVVVVVMVVVACVQGGGRRVGVMGSTRHVGRMGRGMAVASVRRSAGCTSAVWVLRHSLHTGIPVNPAALTEPAPRLETARPAALGEATPAHHARPMSTPALHTQTHPATHKQLARPRSPCGMGPGPIGCCTTMSRSGFTATPPAAGAPPAGPDPGCPAANGRTGSCGSTPCPALPPAPVDSPAAAAAAAGAGSASGGCPTDMPGAFPVDAPGAAAAAAAGPAPAAAEPTVLPAISADAAGCGWPPAPGWEAAGPPALGPAPCASDWPTLFMCCTRYTSMGPLVLRSTILCTKRAKRACVTEAREGRAGDLAALHMPFSPLHL